MGNKNRTRNASGTTGKDQTAIAERQENTEVKEPKSLAIVTKGIRTSGDLANMFAAVICDTLDKSITVGQANVVCNAGGKILRIAEAQMRYGGLTPQKSGEPFQLPSS